MKEIKSKERKKIKEKNKKKKEKERKVGRRKRKVGVLTWKLLKEKSVNKRIRR